MVKQKVSRRDSLQKEIIFSRPGDTRTGFLSNESKNSFVLEEKRWPTVEHYLQAKKFDGTQYEEVIREAPTVFQAKKLARGRMEISAEGGRMTKNRVYGKNSESVYHIREDWSSVEPGILEDAIRAKFTQNKRLQNKLLDTHNAKLIDSNNMFTGPILERLRSDLSKRNQPVSEGAGSKGMDDIPKDIKSPTLTATEKKFVRSVISLSLRIAENEGWDRVFGEMIEDAVYNLASGKREAQKIIAYINSIYSIPWTLIYQDLPNTEKLINEVQLIFKKMDVTQEYQIGPSAMIAAFVRWMRIVAKPEQKTAILQRADDVKKIQIVIPKIKRWYRETTPPQLSKTVKTKKPKVPKSVRTPKSKAPVKQKRPNVKNVPLTPSERELVKKIIYDHKSDLDSLTLNQIRLLLKEELKKSPVMKKDELKKYVTELLKDISPPKKKLKSPKISKPKAKTPKAKIPKKISSPKAPKVSKPKVVKPKTDETDDVSPPKKIKKTKTPKSKTKKPKAKTPKSKTKKSKTPPPPEEIPANLVITDLPKGEFYVWGKPLGRYTSRLLAAGGKYSKKSSSTTDDSVMIFRGKALEKHRELLLKPIAKGGYGGVHPTKIVKGVKNIDTSVVQITDFADNREELQELGGKYPKKSTSTEDRNKIYFDAWARTKVEDIVFDSLSEVEKYNTSYRKWLSEKISDYVDTSIQVAYLTGKNSIDKTMLDIVIKKIYGCNLQIPSDLALEFDYTEMIDTALARKDEYAPYSFTPEAKRALSRYIETVGSILISSLPQKNYTSLRDTLDDFGNKADRLGECPQIQPFSRNEVCIIRALRHISMCFVKYLNYPLGIELCSRAFFTLVPLEWRLGAEQYLSIVLGGYQDWMAEDEIHRYLSENDVKYKLPDIYSVIKHYDTKENSEVFCPSDSDISCEGCMLVFAAALTYITPNIGRPKSSHLLRRIKIMGTSEHSPELDMSGEEDISIPPKEIIMDTPSPGTVNIAESNLTQFQYADVICVLVNSTEEAKKTPRKPLTTSDPVTQAVFRTYPYSNVYNKHKPYDLGSVILQKPVGKDRAELASTSEHRIVACLVSQFGSGKPKKILDTADSRKTWFEDAVKNLFELPDVKGKSIAFAEEQLPPEYVEILTKYAESSDVTVYILTESTVESDPTEKTRSAKSKRIKRGGTPVKNISLQEEDDEDDDVPEEIARAARYYKILKPVKLTNPEYSSTVKKLDSLPDKERNDILSLWESTDIPQRGVVIREYIEQKS